MGPDHEEAGAVLRDAVVGGVEDLPRAVVAGVVNLGQEPLERGAARAVVVRQGVDVLQEERPGLGLREDAGVRLEQAGVGVEAGSFRVEVEPGLAERGAGRAADEQVGPLPSREARGAQEVDRRDVEETAWMTGDASPGKFFSMVLTASGLRSTAGRARTSAPPRRWPGTPPQAGERSPGRSGP